MKKSGFALLALLGLFVGCDGVNGVFNVQKRVVLDGEHGDFSLGEGEYEARLEIVSKRKFVLKTAGNSFDFKFPKGADFPSDNGTFYIESRDLGQPYDAEGVVSTEITRGELTYGRENCSYQVPRTVCYYQPGVGHVCSTQWYTYYGVRDVSYYPTTESKELNIDLIKEGQSDARFEGRETRNYRDYESVSACR